MKSYLKVTTGFYGTRKDHALQKPCIYKMNQTLIKALYKITWKPFVNQDNHYTENIKATLELYVSANIFLAL